MPEADSNSVAVNIYGKTYTFALDSGKTAEQVQKIAQVVDESMNQIKQAHHPPTPVRTAVLAALNLVDELFQLQTSYRAAESDIAQRTSRLTDSLGRIFEQVQVNALGADDL
jgi:cell division protein ZapA (FtsZ GTPase activity inhibitor)